MDISRQITNFRHLFKPQTHSELYISCIAGEFSCNRAIKLRSYICRHYADQTCFENFYACGWLVKHSLLHGAILIFLFLFFFLLSLLTPDRLKMGGGWEWKVVKWERFHQTSPKRYLSLQKVGFSNVIFLFLHCRVTVHVLRVDLNQYTLIELPSQSFSDVKHNESKTRPKLSDTMFSKEVWNAR